MNHVNVMTHLYKAMGLVYNDSMFWVKMGNKNKIFFHQVSGYFLLLKKNTRVPPTYPPGELAVPYHQFEIYHMNLHNYPVLYTTVTVLTLVAPVQGLCFQAKWMSKT